MVAGTVCVRRRRIGVGAAGYPNGRAHVQVNINPAYQSNELAYCINKVGVRALIMIDTFKTQHYYNLLANECHSLPSSRPGQVNDDR
jgi:hypothetical protein